MLRALQLGYVATAKWDIYDATYDIGTQDYSAIGPGTDGWPLRPAYQLLHLLTLTTRPVGGTIVDVVAQPGADPAKLLTAYVSPASDLTILGLDRNGAGISAIPYAPVDYSIGGLPPNSAVPADRLERRRHGHQPGDRLRRQRPGRSGRVLGPAAGGLRADHDAAWTASVVKPATTPPRRVTTA